ncbi:dihydropteroate synthase [Thermanaerovibrio velox DSM 12556]|uniref:Dihydropteroate synthase n=1 Tax=Thermanaerovibrio velox DSM 12556 TaxID=926567 RepID=H0USL4_9BACT|nr:dihydropteroate synthase [Thermanaerovibrio velox]EHM10303.1 dihydropteroate synthase [Thermanaerovibrio velox DSM 12556]
MTPYRLELTDDTELAERLASIGADMRSLPFFSKKKQVLCLGFKDLDFRAANAIKQEMLARGGDAVVHRGAICGSVDRSSVIILGTLGQLQSLAEKLNLMPYFGLQEVRDSLIKALRGMGIRRWSLPLPGGRTLEMGDHTKVMGIINLTPDSFFEASRSNGVERCLKTAEEMLSHGADVLDLGAESTRPGSDPVSPEEELERLINPLRAIRHRFPEAVISVDTYKSTTAAACAEEGADIINDISGLTFDPQMAGTVAKSQCALVLMHIKGRPKDMQKDPSYQDLFGEIIDFFESQIDHAKKAGIEEDRIILDPGIGFGKKPSHNLEILRHTEAFSTLGRPLLIGASRKSTIGLATGAEDPAERLEGTLAVTALCAMKGVPLVRVHDVKENVKTIKMINSIRRGSL